MAPLKFRRLVSFSSEDPARPASGLLSSKIWTCRDLGESSAWVILELEGLSRIKSIDIGNFGSALIQVLVNRSGGSSEFKELLPSSSFQDLNESRSGQNSQRVRMFTGDKFLPDAAGESWDLVKVLCTQPFNKRLRYGLSFITINGVLDAKALNTLSSNTIGSYILKREDETNSSLEIGSLFAKQKSKEPKTEGPAASLLDDMKSRESLASLALAVSHRKEREALEERNQNKRREEEEAKRKNRKRKLEKINELPKRNDVNPVKKMSKIAVPSIPPIEKRKTAPFNRLFSGVVFVLSGYQNPLRSQIRSKALAMGAAYSGDWNSSCTHLICAFSNTPKFTQVKTAGGKIVKKEWIEDGNRDKCRYHWRKYALEKKTAEESFSDEEVWDESTIQSSSKSNQTPPSRSEDEEVDTEDEIENIIETQKKGRKHSSSNSDEEEKDIYDQTTEDDESDLGSAKEDYEAETDVETKENIVPKEYPSLPNYFEGVVFLFYKPPFKRDSKIRRIIIRAGGKIKNYMGPDIHIVVSEMSWDKDFEEAKMKNDTLKFVNPDYILKCHESSTKLSTKLFRINADES